MAEFTPINTQEEFDAAVRARLERERGKFADYDDLKKKVGDYEGQLSDYAKQLNEAQQVAGAHEKTIEQLQATIKGHELSAAKTRVALANGLPYELAGRLVGQTDEELAGDAQALCKLIGRQNPPALPLRDTSPREIDNEDAALKQMLRGLKGEE